MSQAYGTALFVLQKVSCLVSLTGSLMIVSQITRSEFNRSKPQQRLILGLSISDCCTSLIWILTPLFMPAYSGAVWAIGNQTTCNIQGFIVTLFNASAILYMCTLQLQYLLTIRYGWSEGRIRREAEIYMHAFPWALGLAAAITQLALKLFNPADWDCWIAPFPADCTSSHDIKKGRSDLTETDCIRGDNAEIYRWSFFFAPLWVAIAFCITVMVLIFKSVQESERKSMRFSSNRFSNVSNDSVRSSHNRNEAGGTTTITPKLVQTQKVKMQCYMYAGAFFIVWTFPTIARLIQLLGGTVHPIIGVLAGTFIGSQGFFNAIIYFRPRYNAMTTPGRLARVWAIMSMTLFLCCNDLNFRARESRYNSDYVPPPNQSVRSTVSAGNGVSPRAEEQEGDEKEAAARDDGNGEDEDIDGTEKGGEIEDTAVKRVSFFVQQEGEVNDPRFKKFNSLLQEDTP